MANRARALGLLSEVWSRQNALHNGSNQHQPLQKPQTLMQRNSAAFHAFPIQYPCEILPNGAVIWTSKRDGRTHFQPGDWYEVFTLHVELVGLAQKYVVFSKDAVDPCHVRSFGCLSQRERISRVVGVADTIISPLYRVSYSPLRMNHQVAGSASVPQVLSASPIENDEQSADYRQMYSR